MAARGLREEKIQKCRTIDPENNLHVSAEQELSETDKFLHNFVFISYCINAEWCSLPRAIKFVTH